MQTRLTLAAASFAALCLIPTAQRHSAGQQLYNTLYGGTTNHTLWSENAGYINTRPFADGCSDVMLRPGLYMYKRAWAENIGWIGFGNGPLDNAGYTNVFNGTTLDWGVGPHFDGLQTNTFMLSGFAWGENVGWINMAAGSLATPPAPAYFSFGDKRLHGYAWGENIGWLNLDGVTVFASFFCRADFDQNGTVTVQDIFDFLNAWFAGSPTAAQSGQLVCPSGLSVQDIFDLLNAWFAGC